MKKVLLLITIVGLLSSCMKKRWEDPADPAYWLGKWDIEELFETDGNVVNSFTSVSGYVRFKKMLSADAYGKGKFKITYSAPNAAMLSHTEVTYEGEFKWRMQGNAPTIVMEDDFEDVPVLGIGRKSLGGFSINNGRSKWNYVEITTSPLEPGFTGLFHGLILSR